MIFHIQQIRFQNHRSPLWNLMYNHEHDKSCSSILYTLWVSANHVYARVNSLHLVENFKKYGYSTDGFHCDTNFHSSGCSWGASWISYHFAWSQRVNLGLARVQQGGVVTGLYKVTPTICLSKPFLAAQASHPLLIQGSHQATAGWLLEPGMNFFMSTLIGWGNGQVFHFLWCVLCDLLL